MQNELTLRQIVDGISALLAIQTPEGEVEFVNRQVLDYFGKTLEELNKWTSTDAVHPDDLPGLLATWRRSVESGQPLEVNIANGARMASIGGRLIFKTIPAMVYTMNADGDIDLVNEWLLAFLGTTSLAFTEWSDFIHPDDRARVLAVWKATTEARESYDGDLRLRRSDGVYRWFNSRGTPMRDAEGGVVRWYALLTDIDDRKSAEEALLGMQTRLLRTSQVATVTELSASIAHEINQPLASVVTNAHACQTWLTPVIRAGGSGTRDSSATSRLPGRRRVP
jgi:PAS domain S-box-containing protein